MSADPPKKPAADRQPENDRDRLRDQAGRWREQDVQGATARHPLRKERFVTHSDLEVPDLLTPADLGDSYERDLGFPGQFPYTRGVQPTMYRGRLWTMRMFAGFGTPRQTNERFRYLLAQGQTGLSTAFDFPTLMGYDSDSPRSLGEVGMVGVAVDTLRDMEQLFDEIPLDEVTTSMTINGPAAVLLGFYIALADKRGIPRDKIGGTVQNDCLKEFIAQHAWVVPPRPAMRIVGDMIAFCTEEVPRWNTVSISGYHIREAGSTAAQELAFTLADGLAYVQHCIERKFHAFLGGAAAKIEEVVRRSASLFHHVHGGHCHARTVCADTSVSPRQMDVGQPFILGFLLILVHLSTQFAHGLFQFPCHLRLSLSWRNAWGHGLESPVGNLRRALHELQLGSVLNLSELDDKIGRGHQFRPCALAPRLGDRAFYRRQRSD